MAMETRGRKGFGGIRIVVHLTEEILKALDAEVERRKDDRISRAELIRRAIEARYLGRKRDDIDFIKREPPKKKS
jgi:hypothetical protein